MVANLELGGLSDPWKMVIPIRRAGWRYIVVVYKSVHALVKTLLVQGRPLAHGSAVCPLSGRFYRSTCRQSRRNNRGSPKTTPLARSPADFNFCDPHWCAIGPTICWYDTTKLLFSIQCAWFCSASAKLTPYQAQHTLARWLQPRAEYSRRLCRQTKSGSHRFKLGWITRVEALKSVP